MLCHLNKRNEANSRHQALPKTTLTTPSQALLMPGNFAAMPATYSYARAAIGGLLVGIGTGLGE